MNTIIKAIWVIPILSLVTPLAAFLISICIYIYDPSHYEATTYLMLYAISMFTGPAIGIAMLSVILLLGIFGRPKVEKQVLDRTITLALLNLASPVWLIGLPMILVLVGVLFGWAV
jgi:hypothetical protein